MKARPIIFSAPMVRAMLAGTKTQTRRLVKPQPAALDMSRVCPLGRPGDRLWVREAFALSIRDPEAFERDIKNPADWDGPVYRATYTGPAEWEHYDGEGNRSMCAVPWRSPLFMPRWASRITLEITQQRVERLQDISYPEIAMEGVTAPLVAQLLGDDSPETRLVLRRSSPVDLWQRGWDAINGARPGASWNSNPFVWALTFRRVDSKNEAAE